MSTWDSTGATTAAIGGRCCSAGRSSPGTGVFSAFNIYAMTGYNIALAFGVKLLVLVLGAGGLATLWEAVFADVGVALLAILNAVRIQRKRF